MISIRDAITGWSPRVLPALLTALVGIAPGCATGNSSALIGSWSGVCSNSPTLRDSGQPFAVQFSASGELATTESGHTATVLERGRYAVSDNQITLTLSTETLRGTYTMTNSELHLDGLTGQLSSPTWCVMTPGSQITLAEQSTQ